MDLGTKAPWEPSIVCAVPLCFGLQVPVTTIPSTQDLGSQWHEFSMSPPSTTVAIVKEDTLLCGDQFLVHGWASLLSGVVMQRRSSVLMTASYSIMVSLSLGEGSAQWQQTILFLPLASFCSSHISWPLTCKMHQGKKGWSAYPFHWLQVNNPWIQACHVEIGSSSLLVLQGLPRHGCGPLACSPLVEAALLPLF